jgi:hypothetical protein
MYTLYALEVTALAGASKAPAYDTPLYTIYPASLVTQSDLIAGPCLPVFARASHTVREASVTSPTTRFFP